MSSVGLGVESQIIQSTCDVESNMEQKKRSDSRDVRITKQPSWWFLTSTACPLLAGTFGPVASSYNICALVYSWRQYIPPGDTESTGEQEGQNLPDPSFLIALKVASLVCGLVGNTSLLLDMLHRVKFSIAQPVTTAGYLLAGILLIVNLVVLRHTPNYAIIEPEARPRDRHTFTGSFYYGIFAASIYTTLGCLMIVTYYGPNRGYHRKRFELAKPQQALMRHTIFFVTYLLLGASVYNHIEGWGYLNAVYWANTTLLTIGLGDYSPSTSLGRGLLFPFAIGGILVVGLVVGSIHSLILDRGKEKLSTRIVKKKLSLTTGRVNECQQTIRISFFTKVDFSANPSMSQPQKSVEEFTAMRKVQDASERERHWFSFIMSGTFALLLWFVGAVVFQQTEHKQQWTYFESLYFSYTTLLTIGYGDFHPQSDSGKAFFVIWSQLAVPSLTIFISNMGSMVVKSFSDIKVAIASVTVSTKEQGSCAGGTTLAKRIFDWLRGTVSNIRMLGLFGDMFRQPQSKRHPITSYNLMRQHLAERLAVHVTGNFGTSNGDSLDNDLKFYHYVLARECRAVQYDASASPAKKYSWEDWEYFLKLIGNEDTSIRCPENQPEDRISTTLRSEIAPSILGGTLSCNVEPTNGNDRAQTDVVSEISFVQPGHTYQGREIDNKDSLISTEKDPLENLCDNHQRKTKQSHANQFLRDWSWLSNDSPLMTCRSEAEWISDHLSDALVRELDREQGGPRRQPPIGLRDCCDSTEKASTGSPAGPPAQPPRN